MACASKAPAVEIRPSMITGLWKRAAASVAPAIPPISNPPTLLNTSNGSLGSGLFMSIPFWRAWHFLAKASSSTPVPRPVIRSTGWPVITAPMALEGEVLPMPISPVPSSSAPCSKRSAAASYPAVTDCSACSRVMAAPRVKSIVPLATFLTISAFSSEMRAV